MFGASRLGLQAMSELSDRHEITAFIDNSDSKIGTKLNGIPIISPKDIPSLGIKQLYITSCYNKDIHAQLRIMNISPKIQVIDYNVRVDQIVSNFNKLELPIDHMEFAKLMADLRHDNISQSMQIDRISMLHPEALDVIMFFASKVVGGILEIGTYIGAASIALGYAKKHLNKNISQFTSIEVGGKHLNHPHIPSKDILQDFEKNTKNYEVRDSIDLVIGNSSDAKVKQEIASKFKESSIKLLIIDSDGGIDDVMQSFFKFLSEDCYLILDDYAVRNNDKSKRVTRLLDNWSKSGCVKPFGVAGYGTWVGQINHSNMKNSIKSGLI